LSATQQDEILETDDGTFTALQNKIDNAVNDSTITLENDYAYDVINVYNGGKYLVAILKDINDKVISGVKLTVLLNGKSLTQTTDANGKIKVSTDGLAPNKYSATITFAGNTKYIKSSKSVSVTVKKATPKLTAKAKTFKKSVKTKKYIITLKTNKNKAMKNTKGTVIVNKKTYTAKTNKKRCSDIQNNQFENERNFQGNNCI